MAVVEALGIDVALVDVDLDQVDAVRLRPREQFPDPCGADRPLISSGPRVRRRALEQRRHGRSYETWSHGPPAARRRCRLAPRGPSRSSAYRAAADRATNESGTTACRRSSRARRRTRGATRSRSVGTASIGELFSWAQTNSIDLIEINVDEGDVDAQRFYERHGFTSTEPTTNERALYYFREL